MSPSIPLLRDRLEQAEIAAVLACLRTGWLTMGPRTAELEERLAARLGTSHAVAVSSGTAALHLAVRALEIAADDEVILPAISRPAAVHAVRAAGAHAVLADVVSCDCPILDCDDVERRLTDRTRAVVVSHPWGYPADVMELRTLCDERGISLIEDATEAMGALVADSEGAAGAVGDIGCLSLAWGRQLGVGEGGVCVSSDERTADRVRLLRSHALTSTTWDRHRGHADSYDVVGIGFNFRIDEPRAALALARLEGLDSQVRARRAADKRYRERLCPLRDIVPCFDEHHGRRGSSLGFPVLARDLHTRVGLAHRLAGRGIETSGRRALQTEPRSATRPVGAETEARVLVLPLHPWSDSSEQDTVVAALAQAMEG